MLQNEMKKGQTGTTKDDIKFRIEDNKKGNIRLATVYASSIGLFDEIGSIYTSDIATVDMPDGTTQRLEQTQAQEKRSDKTAQLMKSLFG